MIFIEKGTVTLAMAKVDAEGNEVSSTPARFESDPDGGCVVVGELDENEQPINEKTRVFGDYDHAGIFAYVLELLPPTRPGDIPDLEGMFKRAAREEPDGYCPLFDFCNRPDCMDCIIDQWRREVEEETE